MHPTNALAREMDPGFSFITASPQAARTNNGDSLREKVVQLTSVLQTTLDIERLVALFSEHMQAVVPHSSIHYSHPSLGPDGVTIGLKSLFLAEVALTIGTESQGVLVLARGIPFTSADLFALRHVASVLVYPLRNALLYRLAREGAIKDPLTGLYNRLALDEAAKREIDRARRYGAPVSLVCVDIDHFKRINDTWGHSAGDGVIRHVAEIMRQTARTSDMAFRIGGEEFVILAANTTLDGALQLGERIRTALAGQPFQWREQPIDVTLSAGVAECQPDWDLLALFEQADKGLYAAKRGGRNRVCVLGGAA